MSEPQHIGDILRGMFPGEMFTGAPAVDNAHAGPLEAPAEPAEQFRRVLDDLRNDQPAAAAAPALPM